MSFYRVSRFKRSFRILMGGGKMNSTVKTYLRVLRLNLCDIDFLAEIARFSTNHKSMTSENPMR